MNGSIANRNQMKTDYLNLGKSYWENVKTRSLKTAIEQLKDCRTFPSYIEVKQNKFPKTFWKWKSDKTGATSEGCDCKFSTH